MSDEIIKEELLNMKLHETRDVPCKTHDVTVRRVFSGWIYTESGWNHEIDSLEVLSMCFVPESVNINVKGGF